MKCPKCHYLSFEPEPRCKNCGYDLSLSEDDLPIKSDEPEGPLSDLELHQPAPKRKPREPISLGLNDGESEARRDPFAPRRRSRAIDDDVYAGRSEPEPAAPPPSPEVFEVSEPLEVAAAELTARESISAEPVSIVAVTPEPAINAPSTPSEPSEPMIPVPVLSAVAPAADRAVAEGAPVAPARPRPRAAPILRPPPPAGEAAEAAPASEKPAPPRPGAAPSTSEMPLFVRGLPQTDPRAASDEPLVKMPPAPRSPLGVRRSGPEVARPKPRPDASGQPARRLGPFDRDLLEDLQRIEAQTARRGAAASGGIDAVMAMKRLAAACLDVIVLGTISAGVLWFTLRQCGLTFAQVGVLPMLPLLAFGLILHVGYLLMFTVAGGQTIGKMALGLRVVGAFPEEASSERLSFQQAAYRALLTVPSVLALGAGFVPALVGQGRAVHDRLAHTRVVGA